MLSRFFQFVFFVCTCLVLAQSLAAKESVRIPLGDYFAESWDARDGIPHNSINSIAQTPDGYLWVGTWEGTARYNGQQFRLFTRGVDTGLPDSGIRSLTLDNQGHLLVAGSRGGVSRVHGKHWQPLSAAKGMVNHAMQSSNDELWLAMENQGVERRLPDGTTQHFLPDVSTYQTLEDIQGAVWIASNQGLYQFSYGKLTKNTAFDALGAGTVNTLLLDKNGRLLVGAERGAWLKTSKGFSLVHPELKNETITSLLLDKRHDLWLGTINHGLYRLSPQGIEKLSADMGLPNNRILSLLEDQEDSIWIGTNGGLFRLREAPFSTLTTQRGLVGNYVRTVLSHADGSVFVGSSHGLDQIKNNKVQHIKSPFNTPLSVLSLAQDMQGGVYVGTYTDGLLHVKNNKITPMLNRENGLLSNEVRAIFVDDNNQLWIGTAAGLTLKKADGSLQQFTQKNGLPANFVMALTQDSHGAIWVGTGVGVSRFDGEKFIPLNISDIFDAQYAFGFLETPEAMWMATDRGLVRYDYATQQLQQIGKDQGLPVDKIFQIVQDQEQHLWLTSNRGVIHLKTADIKALLKGNVQTINYELFGQADGMKSAQANGGSQHAAVRHINHAIWIATSNGVVIVQPERLQQLGSNALPVVVESMILDNQVEIVTQGVSQSRPLFINADVNRLTFRYAGLGFIMPERIEYLTKLTGYDKRWVERGSLSLTEYTNLAPGHYTFEVKARYPYGPWVEKSAKVHFIIQPHYWQTYSFKLAIAAVGLFILIGAYRYRFYHLKRSEAKLKQRVAEQTKNLEHQAKAFEHQATHDQLTGVPNRRAFDKWLAWHFNSTQESGKSMSVAIFDIDHFKRINDNYSHIVGDKVICEVAKLISDIAPDNSHFARWGGEEFTLLLPNTNAEEALDYTEQIRRKIALSDFSHLAKGLTVSVSVGVADSSQAADYDRLLAYADKALYLAKEQGRNQVVRYQP